jgi:predicted HTH transcriptional regulator
MSNNSNLSNKDDLSNNLSDKIMLDAIITYLKANKSISKSTTAELLGCHPKTAQRILAQFVNDNLLIATGANRNRRYEMYDKSP